MEFLQILFIFQFIQFTRVEKLKSSERKTYIYVLINGYDKDAKTFLFHRFCLLSW